MINTISAKTNGDYNSILNKIVDNWIIEELDCIPRQHINKLYIGFIPYEHFDGLQTGRQVTAEDIRIFNKKVVLTNNKNDNSNELRSQGRKFAKSQVGVPVFAALCSDEQGLTKKLISETKANIVISGRSSEGHFYGGILKADRQDDWKINVSNAEFTLSLEKIEPLYCILEHFFTGFTEGLD